MPITNKPAGLKLTNAEEMTAWMIWRLCGEHKKNCPGESCDLSLGLMMPFYLKLTGKKFEDLTEEEKYPFI